MSFLSFSTHCSSDYYLHDKENNKHYLIELKIGGDLGNKKARSEKEALFEQFAIVYNRFGEGKEWDQSRVLQFFSKDELLIGKGFWNFVCKPERGYEFVIGEYKKNAYLIKKAYLR